MIAPKTPVLQVIIKSRKKEFFNGPAYSVTSTNDTGRFDILPQHANFISIIRDFIIIDEGLPTSKNIKVERGVLRVKNNMVDAYLGI